MSAARHRAARLARKLRALARSPNPSEAERATERARDIASRYDFSEEDLAEVESSGGVAVGGPVGDREERGWREVVALGVGRRWGCRPLRDKERVAFGGRWSEEAVSEYRHLVQEIEAAQDRCWRSYDHKYRLTMRGEHRREFCRAAAEATAESSLGERSHSLQMSFSDEGRREGIAIMRRLRERGD